MKPGKIGVEFRVTQPNLPQKIILEAIETISKLAHTVTQVKAGVRKPGKTWFPAHDGMTLNGLWATLRWSVST